MRGAGLLLVPLVLACAEHTPGRTDSDDRGRGSARSGTVIVAVAEEPDQLCPPFARSPSSGAIWPWILPSLVRVECDATGRIRFEPDLALSWQKEDDGRSMRFFLDSNRLWEDTTAVTGADVVGTYRLYIDRAIGRDWSLRLSDIASIETPAGGQGSVLFRFEHALSSQRALQLASLPLMSMEQWEKVKDRKPLIGEPGRLIHAAGPFRVEEWKPREQILLARHPFPPASRVPRAQAILLRFVPSGLSRSAQLELGAVDYATDLPLEEAARLRDEVPGVKLERVGDVEIETLVWNLNHPLWGARHLRRQVAASLDLLAIRRAAMGLDSGPLGSSCPGFAVAGSDDSRAVKGVDSFDASAPDPRGSAERVPSDSVALIGSAATVDSVKAVGAFGAIGGRDTAVMPSPPPFTLLYDVAEGRHERMAIEIALQLERAGVLVSLLPLPGSECRARIDQRRFDAVLMKWSVPEFTDLGEVWGSGGVLNASALCDPGVDSLIAVARSAAADTIPDAWRRVDERARSFDPFVFIDRRPRIDGLGPKLEGYRPDPLQAYGPLLSIERITGE